MKRTVFLLLLMPALFGFNGCLDNDFEDPPSEFLLNVTPVGESEQYELGDDELQINAIHFAVNNIEITASGENEEFEPNPISVQMSALDMTGLTRLGVAEIFGGDYTSVKMDLVLPPTDGTIDDPLLIEEDDAGNIEDVNSVVISGRYNGLAFTISSDRTEELEFSFDRTISLPEINGVLEVTLVAEWREWFAAQNRERLLDPDDPEERAEILDNFTRFSTAETFTINEQN